MLKSVTLPHLRRPCSKISVMCGERQRRTALEAFSSSDGSGTLVCSEYTRGGKGTKRSPSHPSHHTPHVTPLTSHPSHPTPHIPPLMSHPSCHTPHVTPLMSHPSQFTVYSYITPQRSTYPHTSHTPPHFTTHSTHTPPCPPPQTLIFSTLVSLNA